MDMKKQQAASIARGKKAVAAKRTKGDTESGVKLPGGRAAAKSYAAADPGLRKSDITRQSILDAAARVFRLRGYSGTRLTDIAEEIGMKAGSLYYHFDSREALVEAVMELGLRRTQEAVLAQLRNLPSDADHLTRLRTAIETHLLMVLEVEDYASATIKLIGQVPPDVRERQLGAQRAYGAMWRVLLDEAQAAGAIRSDVDLSAIRMAIMGALNWVTDWYRPGKKSPRKIAADIASVMLNGLAAAGDGDRA
jgi:AcrR family transcriptional regulator